MPITVKIKEKEPKAARVIQGHNYAYPVCPSDYDYEALYPEGWLTAFMQKWTVPEEHQAELRKELIEGAKIYHCFKILQEEAPLGPRVKELQNLSKHLGKALEGIESLSQIGMENLIREAEYLESGARYNTVDYWQSYAFSWYMTAGSGDEASVEKYFECESYFSKLHDMFDTLRKLKANVDSLHSNLKKHVRGGRPTKWGMDEWANVYLAAFWESRLGREIIFTTFKNGRKRQYNSDFYDFVVEALEPLDPQAKQELHGVLDHIVSQKKKAA